MYSQEVNSCRQGVSDAEGNMVGDTGGGVLMLSFPLVDWSSSGV